MKAGPVLAAVAGIAAGAGLIAYFGAGAVARSLFAIGWAGLAAICLIHLALIAIMGLAWRALLPTAGPAIMIWGRLIRDSASEALPLSQVGGYVLGARAVALGGISGTDATASTIVDVTLEFLAQVAYTALALAWLVRLRPDAAMVVPVSLGLVVAVLAAVGFVAVQRHGLRFFDRCAQVLGRGWAERTAASATQLHIAIAAIYRRRGGLWWSLLLHLACWVGSGVEAWIALHLAGAPLPFGAIMVIESLLYATRTVAFAIPNAVGVQEAAYVLLGGTFGLTPELALALSLMKRARDLIIGIPALAAWQAVEGGRLWGVRLEKPMRE
ncbi:MAG: flippase-like domain-containing protein [Alphaproteobacteria bacterium]|nr:flippase-like domain-containing protein [Alphaproteobacteria bacterium]MBV9862992.1 flippase-like domain-containing protein [Alphaproteobacteria bacterium]